MNKKKQKNKGYEQTIQDVYMFFVLMVIFFINCIHHVHIHYNGAPGIIGSVLGLVGPMSVYCDWVR